MMLEETEAIRRTYFEFTDADDHARFDDSLSALKKMEKQCKALGKAARKMRRKFIMERILSKLR